MEYHDIQPYVLKLRRELHKIPEVGLILPLSQAVIIRELDAMGIPYRKNAFDSSIVAWIEGARPGRTVALRADFDALPIGEETGVDYASKIDGAMHACGHDAHASMLLGAAKLIKQRRDELSGNVLLLFQAGEETGLGAKQLVMVGGLEDPFHVDAVFGMHVGSLAGEGFESGTVIAVPGPIMAAFDLFTIEVSGRSGHGSTPEVAIDPINIASHIVINLQELQAREVCAQDSAVLTVCAFNSGTATNIIPDKAVLRGSIRTHNEGVRKQMRLRLEEIAKATAQTFRGSAELQIQHGSCAVVNDEELCELAAKVSKRVCGEENVIRTIRPLMGSEDFAEYTMDRPGVFLLMSTANHANKTDYAQHNSRFNIDEQYLYRGAGIYAEFAMDYLSR